MKKFIQYSFVSLVAILIGLMVTGCACDRLKSLKKDTQSSEIDIDKEKEQLAALEEELSKYGQTFDSINEVGERRELDRQRDSAKMALPAPTPAEQESLISAAGQIGGSGDLKITLLWDFPGDIDIHVKQPSGRFINFRNKKDRASGGWLDVDNMRGGRGSAENVFWAKPPQGNYEVSLHYYQRSTATGEAGSGVCNVVVMRKGMEPQTFRVRMNSVGQSSSVTSFTI